MAEERIDVLDTDLRSTLVKPVRVTLPREVAYDMNRFQEIQKDILGKLGCMACCSGFDIRWDFEQRFIVDANLNVRSY